MGAAPPPAFFPLTLCHPLLWKAPAPREREGGLSPSNAEPPSCFELPVLSLAEVEMTFFFTLKNFVATLKGVQAQQEWGGCIIRSFLWFILICNLTQVLYSSSTWTLVLNLQVTNICHQNENLLPLFPFFLKAATRSLHPEAVAGKTWSWENVWYLSSHGQPDALKVYLVLYQADKRICTCFIWCFLERMRGSRQRFFLF